jgi:hypothetical protein
MKLPNLALIFFFFPRRIWVVIHEPALSGRQ